MNQYYQDPYQKELHTRLKYSFEDDGKFYAELADTIFHPKGGGQKGDKGTLVIDGKIYVVIDTIKDANAGNGSIVEVDQEVPNEAKGKDVQCVLDWDFRYKQMQLHSALHLHHCMIEQVEGKTIKPPKTATIEEGFAFNRYEKQTVNEETLEKANKLFFDAIHEGSEVITCDDDSTEGMRWWECRGFRIPCGGTHIKDISEIGQVDISISIKKGQPTIKFTLPM